MVNCGIIAQRYHTIPFVNALCLPLEKALLIIVIECDSGFYGNLSQQTAQVDAIFRLHIGNQLQLCWRQEGYVSIRIHRDLSTFSKALDERIGSRSHLHGHYLRCCK